MLALLGGIKTKNRQALHFHLPVAFTEMLLVTLHTLQMAEGDQRMSIMVRKYLIQAQVTVYR